MFDIQSYQKAESVSDAIRLLGEDPEARLIAGGTDVLIKLREFEGFSRLVDIHDLPELKPITREADGTVRVGSGASFTDLEESPIIRECIPMLGESAASVAGPQIRNMGTIGGNLCNGAVSADTCAPVLALNGYLNIRGAEGERTIPALGFHTGPGRVALKRDEVLLSVEFRPEDWQGWGAAYHKYAMREAMDIATIGCAAAVRLDGTVISGIRLAYSVSAPIPVRCPSAEAAALRPKLCPPPSPQSAPPWKRTCSPEPRGAPTGISVCTSSARWRNASLPGASSAPSNFRRPPHAENHTLHRQRQGAGTFL